MATGEAWDTVSRERELRCPLRGTNAVWETRQESQAKKMLRPSACEGDTGEPSESTLMQFLQCKGGQAKTAQPRQLIQTEDAVK